MNIFKWPLAFWGAGEDTAPEPLTFPRNYRYQGETCTEASLRLGGNPGLVRRRLRAKWRVRKAFTHAIEIRRNR